MINGKFLRPDTPRPMLVAFGTDARLSYHGELENQRADALRQLGECLASDAAEPTA